ncbi:MAG: hypothetical protein LC660_08310 [Desulfobacteraceae bacterium]|nr:hypothetical protein [Desulfobacteraceae bacterium]
METILFAIFACILLLSLECPGKKSKSWIFTEKLAFTNRKNSQNLTKFVGLADWLSINIIPDAVSYGKASRICCANQREVGWYVAVERIKYLRP